MTDQVQPRSAEWREIADTFRRCIVGIADEAISDPAYRQLPPDQRIEAFVAGTMTAMIGICFAQIGREGRDDVMQYLTRCMPVARDAAERLLDNDQGRANDG